LVEILPMRTYPFFLCLFLVAVATADSWSQDKPTSAAEATKLPAPLDPMPHDDVIGMFKKDPLAKSEALRAELEKRVQALEAELARV
jgi:hypothetical protein